MSAERTAPRPVVAGRTRIENGLVLLLCWPDKHWVGELGPGGALRLYDRRCKTYLLFNVLDLMQRLHESR